LVGGITIVVWKQLTGGWFDVYEIVPGIIFSTIAIVLVSKMTGGATQEVIEQYKEYEKKLVELD
ncbi:sodium:proline symporter, partial [Vibrio astriarenae]